MKGHVTVLPEEHSEQIIFPAQNFRQKDPSWHLHLYILMGFFGTTATMILNSKIDQNWRMQQKKQDQDDNIKNHKVVQHKTPAKFKSKL